MQQIPSLKAISNLKYTIIVETPQQLPMDISKQNIYTKLITI